MEWILSLLIASGIIFGIYCIVWASTYMTSEYQYIGWRKFLKYYYADPDKWRLRKYYVYIYSGKGSDIDFTFGPVGNIRYKLWRYKTKRQDINKKLEEIFGGKNEQ